MVDNEETELLECLFCKNEISKEETAYFLDIIRGKLKDENNDTVIQPINEKEGGTSGMNLIVICSNLECKIKLIIKLQFLNEIDEDAYFESVKMLLTKVEKHPSENDTNQCILDLKN